MSEEAVRYYCRHYAAHVYDDFDDLHHLFELLDRKDYLAAQVRWEQGSGLATRTLRDIALPAASRSGDWTRLLLYGAALFHLDRLGSSLVDPLVLQVLIQRGWKDLAVGAVERRSEDLEGACGFAVLAAASPEDERAVRWRRLARSAVEDWIRRSCPEAELKHIEGIVRHLVPILEDLWPEIERWATKRSLGRLRRAAAVASLDAEASDNPAFRRHLEAMPIDGPASTTEGKLAELELAELDSWRALGRAVATHWDEALAQPMRRVAAQRPSVAWRLLEATRPFAAPDSSVLRSILRLAGEIGAASPPEAEILWSCRPLVGRLAPSVRRSMAEGDPERLLAVTLAAREIEHEVDAGLDAREALQALEGEARRWVTWRFRAAAVRARRGLGIAGDDLADLARHARCRQSPLSVEQVGDYLAMVAEASAHDLAHELQAVLIGTREPGRLVRLAAITTHPAVCRGILESIEILCRIVSPAHSEAFELRRRVVREIALRWSRGAVGGQPGFAESVGASLDLVRARLLDDEWFELLQELSTASLHEEWARCVAERLEQAGDDHAALLLRLRSRIAGYALDLGRLFRVSASLDRVLDELVALELLIDPPAHVDRSVEEIVERIEVAELRHASLLRYGHARIVDELDDFGGSADPDAVLSAIRRGLAGVGESRLGDLIPHLARVGGVGRPSRLRREVCAGIRHVASLEQLSVAHRLEILDKLVLVAFEGLGQNPARRAASCLHAVLRQISHLVAHWPRADRARMVAQCAPLLALVRAELSGLDAAFAVRLGERRQPLARRLAGSWRRRSEARSEGSDQPVSVQGVHRELAKGWVEEILDRWQRDLGPGEASEADVWERLSWLAASDREIAGRARRVLETGTPAIGAAASDPLEIEALALLLHRQSVVATALAARLPEPARYGRIISHLVRLHRGRVPIEALFAPASPTAETDRGPWVEALARHPGWPRDLLIAAARVETDVPTAVWAAALEEGQLCPNDLDLEPALARLRASPDPELRAALAQGLVAAAQRGTDRLERALRVMLHGFFSASPLQRARGALLTARDLSFAEAEERSIEAAAATPAPDPDSTIAHSPLFQWSPSGQAWWLTLRDPRPLAAFVAVGCLMVCSALEFALWCGPDASWVPRLLADPRVVVALWTLVPLEALAVGAMLRAWNDRRTRSPGRDAFLGLPLVGPLLLASRRERHVESTDTTRSSWRWPTVLDRFQSGRLSGLVLSGFAVLQVAQVLALGQWLIESGFRVAGMLLALAVHALLFVALLMVRGRSEHASTLERLVPWLAWLPFPLVVAAPVLQWRLDEWRGEPLTSQLVQSRWRQTEIEPLVLERQAPGRFHPERRLFWFGCLRSFGGVGETFLVVELLLALGTVSEQAILAVLACCLAVVLISGIVGFAVPLSWSHRRVFRWLAGTQLALLLGVLSASTLHFGPEGGVGSAYIFASLLALAATVCAIVTGIGRRNQEGPVFVFIALAIQALLIALAVALGSGELVSALFRAVGWSSIVAGTAWAVTRRRIGGLGRWCALPLGFLLMPMPRFLRGSHSEPSRRVVSDFKNSRRT